MEFAFKFAFLLLGPLAAFLLIAAALYGGGQIVFKLFSVKRKPLSWANAFEISAGICFVPIMFEILRRFLS